jgi:hypothetical protein
MTSRSGTTLSYHMIGFSLILNSRVVARRR